MLELFENQIIVEKFIFKIMQYEMALSHYSKLSYGERRTKIGKSAYLEGFLQ